MAASANTVPAIVIHEGDPPAEEPNRRGDILRAASRLFREKGFAATTTRDIASAVGMRSGSPFYHFKSKQDMLKAVALEGIARIHGAVAEAIAETEKGGDVAPEAIFRAMIRAHLGQLLGEDGQDCATVLLHESRHLEGEALAEMVVLKDRYEALWTNILKRMRAAGRMRHDSPTARLFLMGAMNWSTLWFRPGGRLSAEEIADELTDWVLG